MAIIVVTFVSLLCIALVAYALREHRQQKKLSGTWHEVAAGTFSHVEYGDDEWWERHQRTAMAARSEKVRRRLRLTVIFMDDGRAFVLKGRHDMPFASGSAIRIMENALGRRKIVDAFAAISAPVSADS